MENGKSKLTSGAAGAPPILMVGEFLKAAKATECNSAPRVLRCRLTMGPSQGRPLSVSRRIGRGEPRPYWAHEKAAEANEKRRK